MFMVDAATNECIHWETMKPFPQKGYATLWTDRLTNCNEVAVYNDLIDCQIDICSVDVSGELYSDVSFYIKPICT